MQAGCSLQSELWVLFRDLLRLSAWLRSILTHCSVRVAQDIKDMLT